MINTTCSKTANLNNLLINGQLNPTSNPRYKSDNARCNSNTQNTFYEFYISLYNSYGGKKVFSCNVCMDIE